GMRRATMHIKMHMQKSTVMPECHDTRAHGLSNAQKLEPYLARDPLPDDQEALWCLQTSLLNGGLLRYELPSARLRGHPGETPTEGAGAVARWMALHDRARDLRAAVLPGDRVGMRQVRQAVRSLFLYEHQLTTKTRRRARTDLWQRDWSGPLPA